MSIHKFDEQISERALKNFVKAWDPGKVYFLKGDVDDLMAKYKGSLPGMIARADCKAIDNIFATYLRRFDETYKHINTFIDVKHDFKKVEFLDLDRKTADYPMTVDEQRDRWRKRIKFQHMQLANTVKKDAEVRTKLHKRYSLLLKRHKEINSNEVYETFVNSFSTALDHHSEYYTPSQLEEFHIHTRLYLEGIGALLRSEYGITSIHGLVPGGSAQKSGLVKVGDKIVAVAQGTEAPVDVIDMDLHDVVKLIRGPRGTKVRLTIRRNEKVFLATLTREKVDLPDQATKSRIYELEESKPLVGTPAQKYKIGFIDLPSFYRDFEAYSAKEKNFRSSAQDVDKELKKLKAQNVDLVIVDIRSNGGGALEEAIDVAGLFVGAGPIVQVKKGSDKPYVHKFEGEASYTGPLIIMINQQSASSSEIMAGAIQDYDRGLIIGGKHTFGKGTVQVVDNLDPSLGAIKVTISKFYRPSGASTQKKGVLSDIGLPGMSDLYDIGEKFYDYALEWDEVATVLHRDFKMTKPYLQEIRNLGELRLKGDPDFKKVYEAMKEYKAKEKEHNLISLKIDDKKKTSNKDPDDEDGYEDATKTPKLRDDLHLQETLRIAGDYLRLLKKEKPITLTLLDLEKEKAENLKLDAEKKAPKRTLGQKKGVSAPTVPVSPN
jgi:carboxyl-terminal processing protease